MFQYGLKITYRISSANTGSARRCPAMGGGGARTCSAPPGCFASSRSGSRAHGGGSTWSRFSLVERVQCGRTSGFRRGWPPLPADRGRASHRRPLWRVKILPHVAHGEGSRPGGRRRCASPPPCRRCRTGRRAPAPGSTVNGMTGTSYPSPSLTSLTVSLAVCELISAPLTRRPAIFTGCSPRWWCPGPSRGFRVSRRRALTTLPRTRSSPWRPRIRRSCSSPRWGRRIRSATSPGPGNSW